MPARNSIAETTMKMECTCTHLALALSGARALATTLSGAALAAASELTTPEGGIFVDLRCVQVDGVPVI